jgi:hypothetical protein
MQVYNTQINDEKSLSDVVSTVRAAIEENSQNNNFLMTGSQVTFLYFYEFVFEFYMCIFIHKSMHTFIYIHIYI